MTEQPTEMTGDGNQPEGTGWAPPDTGAGESAESEIPVGVDEIEHTASPDDDAGDTEGGTATIDVSAIPDVPGETAREDVESGDAGEAGEEAEAAAEPDAGGEADPGGDVEAEGADDTAAEADSGGDVEAEGGADTAAEGDGATADAAAEEAEAPA